MIRILGKEVIASPEEVGQSHERVVDLVKGQLQEKYHIAGNFRRECKFVQILHKCARKTDFALGYRVVTYDITSNNFNWCTAQNGDFLACCAISKQS